MDIGGWVRKITGGHDMDGATEIALGFLKANATLSAITEETELAAGDIVLEPSAWKGAPFSFMPAIYAYHVGEPSSDSVYPVHTQGQEGFGYDVRMLDNGWVNAVELAYLPGTTRRIQEDIKFPDGFTERHAYKYCGEQRDLTRETAMGIARRGAPGR